MTIEEELEVLTGKLIRGNITPIVYDLVKTSPYKLDKEHFWKELKAYASSESTTCSAVSDIHQVCDFESFLRGCKRL